MRVTKTSVVVLDPKISKGLMAVASIIFDGIFVVHGIKLLRGDKGLFLSMPCDKKASHCPHCRKKCPLMDTYCGKCGASLPVGRIPYGEEGEPKRLYSDVAHPLCSEFRKEILDAVLEEYELTLREPQNRGYDRRVS